MLRRRYGSAARCSAPTFWPWTITEPEVGRSIAGNELEQRRLAGAGAPGDEGKLARLEREAHVLQRLLAAGIALGDRGEANQPAPRRSRARRTGAGRRCPRRRRRRAAAPAAPCAMAQTTPPFAVPSSLVRMRPGEAERLVERLHLGERVLPGIRVEHEQHVVRRAVHGLGGDALHLADLLHEMELRGQPPGGVGDHDVDAARARRAEGVEHDRAGIARSLRDHRHVVARAPGDELLARGRAERVAGGEHHAQALRLEPLRELADRRGLARAVHARHHDDEGLRALAPRACVPAEREAARSSSLSACLRLSASSTFFLRRDADELLGRRHAAVGLQQRRFQLLEKRLVDLAPGEELRDRRIEDFACARKACLEARSP